MMKSAYILAQKSTFFRLKIKFDVEIFSIFSKIGYLMSFLLPYSLFHILTCLLSRLFLHGRGFFGSRVFALGCGCSGWVCSGLLLGFVKVWLCSGSALVLLYMCDGIGGWWGLGNYCNSFPPPPNFVTRYVSNDKEKKYSKL